MCTQRRIWRVVSNLQFIERWDTEQASLLMMLDDRLGSVVRATTTSYRRLQFANERLCCLMPIQKFSGNSHCPAARLCQTCFVQSRRVACAAIRLQTKMCCPWALKVLFSRPDSSDERMCCRACSRSAASAVRTRPPIDGRNSHIFLLAFSVCLSV